MKRKLKFESCKNWSEVTQLVNETNHIEKNEIDAHSLQKDHNKFIKKKSILKTQ